MYYNIDVIFTGLTDNEKREIRDLKNLAEEKRNWQVRVIQFMNYDGRESEEKGWILLQLKNDIKDPDEMIEKYAEFMKENGQPDLILCIGCPFLISIAKQVTLNLKEDVSILSWLRMPVVHYIERGEGGYESLYLADAHLISSDQIYGELSAFLPGAELVRIFDLGCSNDKDTEAFSMLDFISKVEACIYGRNYLKYLNGDQKLYSGDRISVILPMYNAEKYIARTLNSIFSSNIPLSMLEIIVVDDASKDGSFSAAKSMEERFPENLLLIQCEKNAGVGEARNIGIEHASGNLIAFVDADDIIKPEMLQVLYERMKLFECDITGCDYTYSETGNSDDSKVEDRLFNLKNLSDRKSYIFEMGWRASVCLHLYKRELIMDTGLRFPNYSVAEDLYFQQLYMMLAERDYECSEQLYVYCQNEGSAIHSFNPQKLADAADAQEDVYNIAISHDLISGVEREFEVIYYIRGFSFYVRQMMIIGLFDENLPKYQEICGRIIRHFPDILDNPYIVADQSEENMEMFALLSKAFKDYKK